MNKFNAVDKEALALHQENHGKLEVASKVDLASNKDLTLAYTPGVAAPCLEIKDDYNKKRWSNAFLFFRYAERIQ